MIFSKWVVVSGIIIGVTAGSITGVYVWKKMANKKRKRRR